LRFVDEQTVFFCGFGGSATPLGNSPSKESDMQTDRDRAHRAAMAACALASVFGASTPALANENDNAQGDNAQGHAYRQAKTDAGASAQSDGSAQAQGETQGNAHAYGHAKAETESQAQTQVQAQAHAQSKAKAYGRVKVHGQAAARGQLRVSGDVNVNARSHDAVRLQAKHERSRREHAAAAVQARLRARKVNADLTISTTAPAWVSVWANLFPTSYAAWLTERANANNNGWALGHFKHGVAAELGLKGGEDASAQAGENENSEGNNEESNENANAQANENEQGEGQGTTTVAVGVSGATGSVTAGTGATGTTGTTGTTGSSTGTSGTAGEETSGSNRAGTTGSSGSESGSVLGASTSSGQSGSAAANASVTPARSASSGKLPFTGTDEWLIVAAGALMLTGGLVLRRRLADYR
jgi:hypothetical protein